MDEYISKEYIINKCKEHRELYISAWGDFSTMLKEDKAACDAYATCWSDVVNAPSADVQPIRHGRWIRTDKSMGVETAYACSECGYLVRECDRTNYCGDCGARMDLKDGDAK